MKLRINPTTTAVYVSGSRKTLKGDQVYGMQEVAGLEPKVHIEFISFGLISSLDDVTPQWTEDAKRLLAVVKTAVEVGLVPRPLLIYLLDLIAHKVDASYRNETAFTDEIRKREAEIMAKHYVSERNEWDGINDGPPEWRELQAEISRNFKDVYFDTLKDLDAEMHDVFVRNGWGYDGENSSEEEAFREYSGNFEVATF